jgi:dTDP-4-dehydrorhamnose reductase
MYVVIGKTGYVGEKFINELKTRGLPYVGISRAEFNYTDIEASVGFERRLLSIDSTLRLDAEMGRSDRPLIVVNCAGFVGKPNVDACEEAKEQTIQGNVILPSRLATFCSRIGARLCHISSGCIYSGSKYFTEDDKPNFTFDTGSWYSGSKALAETVVSSFSRAWQFRLRIPFDHLMSPRNYITKCLRYDKLIDVENSVSHLGDFVSACLDIMEQEAPYGIYNVVNPGAVTTKQVVDLMKEHLPSVHLPPEKEFSFFSDYAKFTDETIAPRSNCTLSTDKLLKYCNMRSSKDALIDAISNYTNGYM